MRRISVVPASIFSTTIRTLFVSAMALTASASLTSLFPLHADVLYLNEGEEHIGNIEKIGDGKIGFNEADGTKHTYVATETAHVLFSKIRPGDEISQVASITDPLVREILAKAPTAAQHPDSDYVTLFRRRTFTFRPDGSVLHERRKLLKILKEPGLDEANQSIFYAFDREKPDLVFAHTYGADGRVTHLTDDALSDEAIFSSTPEYDRLKKLKFALKKVDIGSVIDVLQRIETIPPTPLRPYVIDATFGQREPVLADEIVIEAPKNLALCIKTYQWTGNAPRMTDTVNASGNRVISWFFSDPKGYIPEQNMSSRSRIFPRLVITPETSWNDAAKAFKESLDKAAPSPERLDAFLTEAGIASGSQMMKAQRIYEAILKKIRLVDLSCFDYGGYDAPSADVVLKKRYASTFARTVLLYHALRRIGLPVDFGFAASWREGGIKREIPSLGQAEDALLRVSIDGETIYVTCDSDYLPFGHIAPAFQGTAAAFLEGDTFTFAITPEGDAVKNRVDQQVFVKLAANGSVDVRDVRCFRGPFETGIRGIKAAKTAEKRISAENTVKRVHPKARLIDFAYSNLDDLEAPVVLTLSYHIPDAALTASDKLMAMKNLWVNFESGSASLASRTYPMDCFVTSETTTTVVIELPDSYDWVPWNRTFSYACSFLDFGASLTQNGRTLLFADRFRVSRKTFQPADAYPQYRACVSAMADLDNQWIVLEKADVQATATPAQKKMTASETSHTDSPGNR
ncbi:MAG: DUF3857 domain-containing protein [Candidatus Riflebacteria bacterium]|nr:DUF3857 domain-containing protein [Candidatus Riflebacteria bacterium]